MILLKCKDRKVLTSFCQRLLRTVFLQVPIISNPVGGVGGRSPGLDIGGSKETLASAYVLRPLKTSVVSIYERVEE